MSKEVQPYFFVLCCFNIILYSSILQLAKIFFGLLPTGILLSGTVTDHKLQVVGQRALIRIGHIINGRKARLSHLSLAV
jgi:hypothetical protein